MPKLAVPKATKESNLDDKLIIVLNVKKDNTELSKVLKHTQAHMCAVHTSSHTQGLDQSPNL